MATEKQDLQNTAESMGIKLKGNENTSQLKELIENYVPAINNDQPDGDPTPNPNPSPSQPEAERMVPMSDVKRLIAEEMAKMREKDQEEKGVKKVKRVQEHHVQIHRWNSKWVVDFVDQNKDPYLKTPVHAYNVWNEQQRQFIAHLELVLWDEVTGEKSTEVVALTRYLERRLNVYCLILVRQKIDATYSIGEVEIKKEGKDGMMHGTGVYRDQDVEMVNEIFEVKLPTGMVIKVPDYAVC